MEVLAILTVFVTILLLMVYFGRPHKNTQHHHP